MVSDSAFRAGYPNKPASWNRNWESQPLNSPLGIRPPPSGSGDDTEPLLASYRAIFRDLCGVQRDLAVKVEMIKNMEFNETWQSVSKDTRQKYMLEGHVRGCEFLKTDASRIYSVDVTLESLEKGNGTGFLNLMKTYTLADSSRYPENPLSFPFPGSDKLRPTTDPRIKAARELYIGFFLLFTIMSYYGVPMPTIPPRAKVPLRGTADGKAPKQQWSKADPPVKACESCEQPEGDTPLLQCRRCRDVDLSQRTWYCSKVCQKADWPRHKPICGRKLTLESARSTAIPPAPNGHPL